MDVNTCYKQAVNRIMLSRLLVVDQEMARGEKKKLSDYKSGLIFMARVVGDSQTAYLGSV